jgi:hypothetical protein
MNINHLIRELQDIRDQHGNIEVRLANQPNWPIEYSIAGIVVNDPSEQIDSDDNECEDECETVAFIGEGSQIGYLSGRTKQILENTGVW